MHHVWKSTNNLQCQLITVLSQRTAAAFALISHLHLCSCLVLLIRLIIFPQLCFSMFCCHPLPPPLYFSLALSGERYEVAPKSSVCGSMGIFQLRDNRNAALTGAIELILRPGSDNVITAVLRPLIPPPQPALYKEQEAGGGGHRALFQ